MKSTFWMTAQETEDELKSHELDLGTSLDQVTKWMPEARTGGLANDSPEIVEFLQLWPSPFGRAVRAKQRRAYIAIDYANGPDSWCGAFLVDRLTHRVFITKGYGVKGRPIGTIESLISDYLNQQRIHGKTF